MKALKEMATDYYNAEYPTYKPVKCKNERTIREFMVVRAFIAGYNKANELNKSERDSLIAFANKITAKDSMLAILYGEDTRFCTEEKDMTTEEVVDEYLRNR
jgi:hypothetical protein